MKNLNIVSVLQLGELETEIVERKGIGHPDTIADALAENLSVVYSRYTLDHFGAILHHNFDKVSVLGGTTEVDFGHGRLTSPIRVILNGRASVRFADKDLPVRDLLETETRRFFSELFEGYINPQQDLDIHWFVSRASGARSRDHTELVCDKTDASVAGNRHQSDGSENWATVQIYHLLATDCSLRSVAGGLSREYRGDTDIHRAKSENMSPGVRNFPLVQYPGRFRSRRCIPYRHRIINRIR